MDKWLQPYHDGPVGNNAESLGDPGIKTCMDLGTAVEAAVAPVLGNLTFASKRNKHRSFLGRPRGGFTVSRTPARAPKHKQWAGSTAVPSALGMLQDMGTRE